jgi:hypothetical protein
MPIRTPNSLFKLYGHAKWLLKKQWQSRNRVTRRPEVKLRMSDLYPPTRFAKTYGRANKNLEVMAERKGEA